MMAYNPPHYGRLIEGYGFRKAQESYTFWGGRDMLPAASAKHAPIAADSWQGGSLFVWALGDPVAFLLHRRTIMDMGKLDPTGRRLPQHVK